jgi:hypothetical protein
MYELLRRFKILSLAQESIAPFQRAKCTVFHDIISLIDSGNLSFFQAAIIQIARFSVFANTVSLESSSIKLRSSFLLASSCTVREKALVQKVRIAISDLI